MSQSQTLADLGMDSIMGAEVKQVLERNYDIVLSAQEIRGLTMGKLASMSSGGGAAGDASASPAKDVQVRDICFCLFEFYALFCSEAINVDVCRSSMPNPPP